MSFNCFAGRLLPAAAASVCYIASVALCLPSVRGVMKVFPFKSCEIGFRQDLKILFRP